MPMPAPRAGGPVRSVHATVCHNCYGRRCTVEPRMTADRDGWLDTGYERRGRCKDCRGHGWLPGLVPPA